jgi:hypothetical protein
MPSTGGVKLGSDYDVARTRKVTAEAEIAELELQKLHGTLCVTKDVILAWEDVLSAFKGKLLSIPTKAAPVLCAETEAGLCQVIIEDLIKEALEELSTYEPSFNATQTGSIAKQPKASDKPSKTANKTQRKRVGRPKKTARLAE